ncbi:MAG: hypothetical protein ACRDTW_24750 [Rhodococcus qingshengii]|uniref:hypothetical protein n=1 Tax=Rhodococcus sp. SG20037 TaxID=3074148 RepID=UPI00287F671D|nr:hypothetical protein [Rhodococcus sp. SG20037]WNF42359.1 hypothetical protein RHP72_02800 [Rhodococcus sp. SG20037]
MTTIAELPNRTTEALRTKLPERAQALLDGRDGSYSEWATASALAMYALNAGLNEDEFVSVVTDSDFASEFATENGRDRSSRLDSRLRKVWERAEDDWNPGLGSIQDVRDRIAALSNRLDQDIWTGRTASTDRAVALALVAWAHELGTWTVDASSRELGLRAGVGNRTASRALQRLADIGVVRQVEMKRVTGHAQTWALNMDWTPIEVPSTNGHNDTHISTYGGRGICVSLCHFGTDHPAFLGSALGRTAERIWLDLAENGDSTVSELAQRLGINLRTTRRNLDERLVPNGLVMKADGRPAVYSVDPTADADRLDRIAESFGTLDWQHRTAERHERERAGFAELLRQQEQQQQATERGAVPDHEIRIEHSPGPTEDERRHHDETLVAMGY